MLLYLHGFESSPESSKAQLVKQAFAAQPEQLLMPQLPANMPATQALLDDYVRQYPIRAVMGSSLGGFWSHYVASQMRNIQNRSIRGVLINPAVEPGPRFAGYEAERVHPYLQQPYSLGDADIESLRAAHAALRQDLDLLVLLQQADETLNYRDAAAFYQSQRMLIEQGGNHRFEGLERYLPTLLEFLKVL